MLWVTAKITGWNKHPSGSIRLTFQGPRSGTWETSIDVDDAARLSMALAEALRQLAAEEGYTLPAYVKLRKYWHGEDPCPSAL